MILFHYKPDHDSIDSHSGWYISAFNYEVFVTDILRHDNDSRRTVWSAHDPRDMLIGTLKNTVFETMRKLP